MALKAAVLLWAVLGLLAGSPDRDQSDTLSP